MTTDASAGNTIARLDVSTKLAHEGTQMGLNDMRRHWPHICRDNALRSYANRPGLRKEKGMLSRFFLFALVPLLSSAA